MAITYCVAGRLALLMAIPPGYATAVRPAAGIALAAVLAFGYRVWPGVLLGSFFVNIWTSWDATNVVFILRSISAALGIALGAALQAVAGAWAIRRVIRPFPSWLEERNILKLLALGGPAACSINATCGVGALALTGVVPWSNFLFSWGTWWVGDSIGVLVFTPLTLLSITARRAIFRRGQLAVSLPTAFTFALVTLLFIKASGWEQEGIGRKFEQRSDVLVQALRQNLVGHVKLLDSIESFYAGSPRLDRRGFHAFCEPLLAGAPGVQALSYNTLVRDADRNAFETAIQKEGIDGFQIRVYTAGGELTPAPARPEYVVVTYIEPHAGNERAMGLDVASEDVRRHALDEARDTGRTIATSRLSLVQEKRGEAGLLLYRPIYRKGAPRASVEERRANLLAYATGVFRVGNLVENTWRGMDREGFHIELMERSEKGDILLYPNLSSKPTDVAWERSIRFEIAGRPWLLVFSVPAHYLLAHQSWQAWTVLVAGLLFTGLLEALILILTQRTAALENINRNLQFEIDARLNAEKDLLIHQQQLQKLASQALVREERERRRIASDLHDSIGQTLALCRFRVRELQAGMRGPSRTSTLSKLRRLIEKNIRSVRSLTFDLSPPVLHELGLGPALHWLMERFERDHGLRVEYQDGCPIGSMGEEMRILLFRATRELLMNVIRHSGVKRAQLALGIEDGKIRIEVRDRGAGFDAAGNSLSGVGATGFGLFSIQDRLRHMGGRMEVRSGRGRGTSVTVWVPLQNHPIHPK